MNVEELFKILEVAIDEGYGDCPIYFDTDARTFDYHMAKIGRAHVEAVFITDTPFVWLGEERK